MERQSPTASVHSIGDIIMEEDPAVPVPAELGHIEIIRTVSPGLSTNEPSHVEIIRTTSPVINFVNRNSPYIEISTETGDSTDRTSPYVEISTISGDDRSNYVISPVGNEYIDCNMTQSQPVASSSSYIRPQGAMRSQSLDESHTIRQVIMVNPGEDVQDATNRALANITENLNRRAQQTYALGHSPIKETVIEITSVTPGVDTGYFSREELLKKQQRGKVVRGRKRTIRRRPASQPVGSPPFALSQFERECHTPPTTFTAAPPVLHSQRTVLTPTALRPIAQGYTPPALPPASCGTSGSYTALRPATQESNHMTASFHAASDHQCSSDHDAANVSLTNIGWLKSSDCQSVPSIAVLSQSEKGKNSQSEKISLKEHQKLCHSADKEIQKVNDTYCDIQRPPYSYQQLIQMALSSRPDLAMTLKDIYKWIEETFPYYGNASRQGWKNSIRHNLSLSKMFVREKPDLDKDKSSVSQWKLLPEAPKSDIKIPVGSTIAERIAAINQKELDQDSRKGKPLLLPKIPGNMSGGSQPIQTYAIIPIQGGIPIIPHQPIMVTPGLPMTSEVTASGLLATRPHSATAELGLSSYNQKRQLSPTANGPTRKQVKIAPKLNSSSNHSLSRSLNTTDLGHQLAKIKFDSSTDRSHRSYGDSGIECSNDDISLDDRNESRSNRVIPGIPKPKMYGNNGRKTPAILRRQRPVSTNPIPSKRRSPRLAQKTRTSRKSNLGQLAMEPNVTFPVIRPSTPTANKESYRLLADMESPMKGLLSTPPKRTTRMTSTPIDGQPMLEDMISPIKGLTPLGDANFLDSGIFTPIHDSSMKSYQLESTPEKMSTSVGKASLDELGLPSYNLESTPYKMSPSIKKSPLPGSLRDLGLPGLTPIKGLSFDIDTGFTPPVKPPKGLSFDIGTGFTPPSRSTINSGIGFTPTRSPLGLSTGLTPNKSLLGLNTGLANRSPSSVGDQSFTKLLGDFHLESFMDEPVIDINDISWSMLQ